MCEEYQRNYYLAGSLLKQIGTKSKQDLLNFHLARQKVSFSQFINNNQHELYHLFCSEKCCQCTSTILTKTPKVLNSKEMELLFNKMSKMHCHKPASTKAFCCSPSRVISYVDDLDITLLQCLLTNFCLDLFWRICLSNENKNLETFLNVNKHILFHLWKRNDKCCKSKDLSGRINDRQWAIIFETTHCGSNNIDACQFSVKKGIIEKNLDTGLARVIFGNICPLFMSIQKLAQSRNDLARSTKGELSNMEYSTIWSNSTECIIAIARYLGKELEVKADIEVLKEKIPSFDVYKILHTHMLDTYKLQEPSIDVSDLIDDSYRKFGHISNQEIDKLRLKYRLQVVQNIEDSTMRNIIRSVASDTLFKGQELKDLYVLFKEEYLTSCYWRTHQQPVDTADKYDPSRPYYELYKIDFDQFKTLFSSLSPWATGQHAEKLALYMFRLIDENKDNMINFKEFVYILGVVCKADITHKLKLLYTCHQPPALLPTDKLDEESDEGPVSPVSVASTDEAEEATDFFTDDKSLTDSPEIELSGDFIEEDVPDDEPEEPDTDEPGTGDKGEQKSSEEQASGNPQATGTTREAEKTGAESDGASVEVPEAGGYYKATDIQFSYQKMAEKKRELNRSDSKADLKNVPRLTQVQFIQLWKTLYDMFHDHPHEQQLYHSIATVGTLLLEIGEVGERFYLKSVSESSQGEGTVSVSEVDTVAAYVKNVTIDSCPSKNSGSSETKENAEKSNCNDDSSSAMSGENLNVTQQDSGISEQSGDNLQSSTSDSSSQPHSKPDSDWSISFEQFIASMLTEPPLVEYFEKIIDITEDIAKMRNRRLLTRQQSTWETQKQNSKK